MTASTVAEIAVNSQSPRRANATAPVSSPATGVRISASTPATIIASPLAAPDPVQITAPNECGKLALAARFARSTECERELRRIADETDDVARDEDGGAHEDAGVQHPADCRPHPTWRGRRQGTGSTCRRRRHAKPFQSICTATTQSTTTNSFRSRSERMRDEHLGALCRTEQDAERDGADDERVDVAPSEVDDGARGRRQADQQVARRRRDLHRAGASQGPWRAPSAHPSRSRASRSAHPPRT